MGWKHCEKPKTVLASPALVREFVEMEPAPYDRPLSERRLQIYERILRNGEFRPVVWASAVCYETNCTYRVNGKHTSLMLSKLDKLPDFHVTVERYHCDTLKDVANLYNTFDSNLAGRSANDINMAFAASIPDLKGLPSRFISMTISAAAFHKWDENELKRIPPAERAEELVDNVDFAIWLNEVLPGGAVGGHCSNSTAKALARSPVVSAMMATYRRGPRVSKEFWELVRDESAADRDDPSRVLARYLIRVVIASGRGNPGETKKMATHREIYAKCIHAWNAWRKGERTSLNYHAKSPLPEATK